MDDSTPFSISMRTIRSSHFAMLDLLGGDYRE
jgi:hypothetical protein